MENAEPGDVYVDGNGKLWRVVGVMRAPSVTLEEIEPLPQGVLRDGMGMIPPRQRLNGAMTALMWSGFKVIYHGHTREVPRKATNDD